ncbi:hypothetical protein NDU88_001951 [Pleurodeles waltl]|uniref:Uncharacterized protein n=1 Tax=Pleurodeles waltl TaxID=8319 RepID=A0AAV7U8B5_PLEWA|nr:hypothetical protein NDU88_001951 [Pleurodeles waltl]
MKPSIKTFEVPLNWITRDAASKVTGDSNWHSLRIPQCGLLAVIGSAWTASQRKSHHMLETEHRHTQTPATTPPPIPCHCLTVEAAGGALKTLPENTAALIVGRIFAIHAPPSLLEVLGCAASAGASEQRPSCEWN